VELSVVTENAATAGFYEACGFTVIKDYQATAGDPCRDEIRITNAATKSDL